MTADTSSAVAPARIAPRKCEAWIETGNQADIAKHEHCFLPAVVIHPVRPELLLRTALADGG